MDEMQIELRSPLRKFFLGLVCLVFVGLYLQWALRAYLASHRAAVPDSAHLEKAIRLEPSNAEYRDLFGRNLSLSGISLDEAIANYRIAVQLNPYVARYWLDLAGAYQIAGRTPEQEASVEQAAEADRTTPHVAWEAANFFLVQGDREKALRYFRVVLANAPEPDTVDSALRLCWQATEDENQILAQALPPRPDLYLSFLRLLVNKQQTSGGEKRLEPADRIEPGHFRPSWRFPISAFSSRSRKSQQHKLPGSNWRTSIGPFNPIFPPGRTWS